MILRIGILNNFNFSKKEMKQLDGYKGMNMFVNSNSFTTIKAGVKSIVTINPYMKFFWNKQSNLRDVSACRVKVVGDAKPKVTVEELKSYKFCIDNNKPILITFMRFSSQQTLLNYAQSLDNYVYKRGYYYYKHDLKVKLVDELKNIFGNIIHVCDLKEKGCPECMNCSKLTFNTISEPIYGINFSSSGYCPYNCPDCFAKRLIKLGKNRIKFDYISQNEKQLGIHKK
jgi:hypothetical protein